MKIGFLSLGLLSGSLAKILRMKFGDNVELYGFSRQQTIEKAKKLDIFNDLYEYGQLQENISKLDVLFLCSPIEIIKKKIIEISKLPPLKKKLIVTDIGSTKFEIVDVAKKYLSNRKDIVFVGGHPMAGNEYSGVEHSDPYLFENAFYVLSPMVTDCDLELNKLIELIVEIGSTPIVIDAKSHDRIAAIVSHVPQLLASSLVSYLSNIDDNENIKKLAAGGFRDMTRIASSSFRIWHDILKTNRENVKIILGGFIDYLSEVLNKFDNCDNCDNIEEVFDKAAEYRDLIPVDTRGFINKIWYITLRVPDENGVLFKVTKLLYEHNINIKDFSVVKIREQISGSIRFGFSSKIERDEVKKILEKNKYEIIIY